MASYKPFGKKHPKAFVEENIFDPSLVTSWENVLEFPKSYQNQLGGAVEFVPTALLYQQTSDGLRYYVLHPVTMSQNWNYRIVTVDLEVVFKCRSVNARTKRLYQIIEEYEAELA